MDYIDETSNTRSNIAQVPLSLEWAKAAKRAGGDGTATSINIWVCRHLTKPQQSIPEHSGIRRG